MAYTKTSWVNGSGPDLDQTNLNKMETGIAEAHDRFTLRGLDADKPAASALTANRLYVVTGGGIYVDTGTALEFVAARTWDQLTGKPASFPPAAHSHGAADLPASTETATGIVELATAAETQTGTDAVRAVHPAGLAAKLAPQAMRLVGGAGEPAFESLWVNFGAPYAAAGFYKDSTGRVHLSGSVKSGTLASTATIFTLPVGYRPSLDRRFAPENAGATNTLVIVQADGRVVPFSGANAILALDGISFRAEG